ncbi:MAG: hypothetical protein A3I68_06855 [Candidatus Melainabacteria bacterium RIFCSPLOWO2_02_FULL_35_15]|nr:MAG: hypothetical protein A3F80_04355 [Candidatus Melainabacteria bacterium RIFCSPLOWO2_12_FULL_35_11]OGI13514.1 MAG: hypothetical protein A3I68_06855 [Candidatus Melainabacteria bacterium RIFCSPLOWO2_02_FULL_35_15]
MNEIIHLNGKGLFSKEEVTVSIGKGKINSGIVFAVNSGKKEFIPAKIENVLNAKRNTVLTNGKESICLVEHFLAACSLLGIDDIEITTNQNELILGDGSALHWQNTFLKAGLGSNIKEKYDLKETIFIKKDKKQIAAIPHDGFKVSYYMDWEHSALGKLFASWEPKDGKDKILRARTFGTKEENDYFGVSDRLLTLDKNGFSKNLYEPLEPLCHKILDIIGDLRLSGINPLEVNMHVIGFKSGHELNVELARSLSLANLKQTV